MQSGVYLTSETLAGLSSEARAEVAGALFPATAPEDEWEATTVRLTPAEADEFVENCGDKSRTILQLLVESDGELSHRAVRDHFGETAAQLKSAWGGLTKRAGTIAKQKSAALVEWNEVGGEWIAYMHPITVASLRAALEKL